MMIPNAGGSDAAQLEIAEQAPLPLDASWTVLRAAFVPDLEGVHNHGSPIKSLHSPHSALTVV